MTTDKKHQIREQLALISTEVYLMTQDKDNEQQIERYDMVQASIDAILMALDDRDSLPQQGTDIVFQ